jgi:hypothetical protein
MECHDVRKNLSAYLEGTVSPGDRELIDQHLASCRACSKVLYELNRTAEVLRHLKEVEPPPGMKQKIMARVREEAEPKKGFIQKFFYPLHIKVPLEAFAMVLIAVIAVYVFKTVEPQMKDLRVPSVREPVIARQEAPYPAKAPAAEMQAAQEKAVPQESPAKTKGKDLAVAQKETEKRAGVDEEGGVQKLKAAPKKEAALAPPAEPPRIGESRIAERAPSPPAAVGSVPTREDKMVSAEGAARERKERMAAKAKPEGMRIVIQARDIRHAGEEAVSLLDQLGASRIDRLPRESNEIITAELKAENIRQLVEKLRFLGEVQEKDAFPASPEKDATVRIEIVPAR